MNRKKCNYCGFINFATEVVCKKCNQDFEEFVECNESKQLGKLNIKSRISIPAIILLLIGGILTFVSGLFALFYRDGLGNDFSLAIFLFGVIPILCCLYTVKFFLGKKKITVYENGFIYSENSKEIVVLWNEIRNICETIEWLIIEGIPVCRATALTLTADNGEKITLMQDIGGIRQIRKHILKKCKTIYGQ